MKDIIKRSIISIISWALIGYLLFLFTQWSIIVHGEFLQYNTLYYILLAIVCLYLFIFFGIYPVRIKMTKATLFVCGLALIIIWDTVLLNNISEYVYVGDLFKLMWVLLTILAWTNILVTSKVKKQSKDKNVEVIEV